MLSKTVNLLITSWLLLQEVSSQTDKVICYYESWHEDTLAPEEFDLGACTHINYAFLGVDETGSLVLDDTINNTNLLNRITALKEKKPSLKVMISVGGWTDYAETFSKIAADEDAKQTLVDDIVSFLKNYNLDGVDLGWEFPTAEEQVNFNDLLSLLRTALDDNGNYQLSIAADHIPYAYDVKTVSKIVDFINVLTYDLHNGTEGRTGQNSPLFPSVTDTPWQRNHSNCNSSITNWINAGAPPGKLILGMAFYGKAFVLADPDDNGVGALIKGGGEGGGSHYRDICQLVEGWTEVWDDEQKTPYKYSGDQWIGFDNAKSISLKVEYAKNNTLGGVMFFALNYDDKDGNCGTKNPLQQAIVDALNN